MEKFEKMINNQLVVLTADEQYEKEALDVLAFLEDAVEEINEDALVSFHYAYIGFVKEGEAFHVYAPDLAEGDIDGKVTDLTYFLSIIEATFKMAKRTKTLGKLINFTYQGTVVLANDVFDQSEIYAHRYEDDTWYIGPIDQSVEQQPLMGAKAYQVFYEHPELYGIMHLPTDYIAMIKDGEVLSVLDIEGENVLK
ncbi:hypothetical protein SAMN05421767_10135 [Granulicatella balaenopterae]|uniref:Imm33-like domain-containing protein n=1 Tax=Granulicatella balaenopterae TaxID=137733 RepID=A0A1H9GSR9_9LACT|nr:hypothetical protein [Granulicatella balaenopterae]SEQ53104.1 hypothetical protein SAMN05421767_10135 [Granulicatella balaenopterae]